MVARLHPRAALSPLLQRTYATSTRRSYYLVGRSVLLPLNAYLSKACILRLEWSPEVAACSCGSRQRGCICAFVPPSSCRHADLLLHIPSEITSIFPAQREPKAHLSHLRKCVRCGRTEKFPVDLTCSGRAKCSQQRHAAAWEAFGWALCVEVPEHLEQADGPYLLNLGSPAPSGELISGPSQAPLLFLHTTTPSSHPSHNKPTTHNKPTSECSSHATSFSLYSCFVSVNVLRSKMVHPSTDPRRSHFAQLL